MFKNYLKVALRNLWGYKIYSFINIFGLAIGIACFLLILLFVCDELSYDHFHENADRIYRIVRHQESESGTSESLSTSALLRRTLLQELPEVEHAVRFSKRWPEPLVTRSDESFYEHGFFFTDSTVFDMFGFELVRGNPQTALTRPQSLVITESVARKYFGEEDPTEKILSAQGNWGPLDFTVTGVMKDPPHNTHVHPRFLASYTTLDATCPWPDHLNSWFYVGDYTYILLREGYDPEASGLEAKMMAFAEKYQPDRRENLTYLLQPITDIHLFSHFERELEPNSDVRYVYIFSIVALLILTLACINYTNLATARAAHRAREVCVRKVVGADRGQLLRQFLSESVLMTQMAFVLAVMFVELILPAFDQLTSKSLSLDQTHDLWVYAALIGVVLAVGFLTGSYPALFLSRFRPVNVLRGSFSTRGRSPLRSALVVFQFAVSIALITGTLIVQQQLDYVRTKRLGLNPEQIVVIDTKGGLGQQYRAFKKELLRYAGITSVTAAGSSLPAQDASTWLVPEGFDQRRFNIAVNSIPFDPDFLETLDIELAAGEVFPEAFGGEFMPVLINETAARQFGWDDPMGKTFSGFSPTPTVVGVVKDFHYQSLHEPIAPLVIMPTRFGRYMLARVQTEPLPGALDFMREKWAAFGPGTPFIYTFMDEQFERLYQAEDRLARVFGVFSFVAIFIGCLGLFGLAAYTAEQRTKEIGIRKVLGASVSNILSLLSKDFVKLVLWANLIAWPVAWYAMNRWLQNFAYRIDLGWWVFALAGGLALIIALSTVSTQAIKTALANPVESLRYE